MIAPSFPSLPVDARVPPFDRALLARMRMAARTCRAGARVDASRTGTAPGAGMMPCLGALAATAPQATGRHLTFYRPGEAEVSFDEAWLLALIEAAARDDGDSLRFLVARRVAPPTRARIAFLARCVAEARASGIEGGGPGAEDSAPADARTALT